jgi:hypothetical protein
MRGIASWHGSVGRYNPAAMSDASIPDRSRSRRFFRKAGRFLIFAFLGLLALLVLLYAVAVSYMQDEPLDVDLAALLAEAPPPIDPNRNAYFAWIGIQGTTDESAHAWGQRWYEQALSIDAGYCRDTPVVHPAVESTLRRDEWPTDGMCSRVGTCLDKVAKEPGRARALLTAIRPTLDRADSAMTYPEYQEAHRPDFCLHSPFAPYPRGWHSASAARFALDVAEDRHAEAITRLARETRFHVLHMAGAETMFDKMVAASYVRNNYLLLASYLRRHPDRALAHGEQIAAILAPLPAEATSLRKPLRAESKGMARLVLDLPKQSEGFSKLASSLASEPSWLADVIMFLTFQPRATANEGYAFDARYIDAEAMGDNEYRIAIADAARYARNYNWAVTEHFVPHNFVGRILASVHMKNPLNFQFRRDDLLVIRAVLARRFSLLRQGASIDMATFAKDPAFIHRYTGESPHWDAEARALVYPPNDLRKNKAALAIEL